MLDCSVRTVERMENKRLRPYIDPHNTHRFNPNEVHALQHKTRGKSRSFDPPKAGDIAAAVFDLLEQKKSKREIVVQLHLEPREVQRLWDEWSHSFEDTAEERKRAELRQRHEARKRDEAERRSRERIARMKVEKASIAADEETAKELRRALRLMGVKVPRRRSEIEQQPVEPQPSTRDE